jgi:hypothetical protein
MTAETVRVDPARETPVTSRQRERFGYRYAYARSADSRAHNDPGQDYLILREDGRRLAFVLCDGVSQSFYGDLAAQLLGDALVEWLWNRNPPNPEAFREELADFLDALVETAAARVAEHPLPENLPPIVRQVLEEKRALGSETTFVAGLLDTDADVLLLAWMGDSRLRLWGKEGERTDRLGDTFHTQERWSTRRGRIGELHTARMPLSGLRYLIAYSDGLARLDRLMTRHFRDGSIQSIIEDAAFRPESDDIAFLEVWLGDRRPVEYPPLPAPSDVQVQMVEGKAKALWSPVSGARFYEVRLGHGTIFSVHEPERSLELPPEALAAGEGKVQVRAWDEEPGEWSKEVIVTGQTLSHALPAPSHEAPAPEPFMEVPASLPGAAAPLPASPSAVPSPRRSPHPSASWRRLFPAGLAAALILCALGGLAAVGLLSYVPSLLSPPTPTFTPTPTSTPTPTPTLTPTPTFTPTATPAPAPTLTPNWTPMPANTPTPTIPTRVPAPPATPAIPLTPTFMPPLPPTVVSHSMEETICRIASPPSRPQASILGGGPERHRGGRPRCGGRPLGLRSGGVCPDFVGPGRLAGQLRAVVLRSWDTPIRRDIPSNPVPSG